MKSKEKNKKYIPARYIFATVLTIIEILLIIDIVLLACWFLPYLYWATIAIQFGCVIHIISSDENPDHKIPWVIVVIVLPIAGFMLYFLFHSRKFKRKYVKRLKALNDMSHKKCDLEIKEQLK